jgi:hypothetical protein
MHDFTLLDSQKALKTSQVTDTASFDSMAFNIVDSRILHKAELQKEKVDSKTTQIQSDKRIVRFVLQDNSQPLPG